MFRRLCGRLAAKSLIAAAGGAPVSPATIAATRAVASVLAATNSVAMFPPAVAESAIQKTKGEGLAGAAALLGRSQILLGKREDLTSVKIALADVDAVTKATAGNTTIEGKQLHRLALVTRARIFNILLDEQESLFANGAGKEGDVSTARGLVREAYNDLLKCASKDALAALCAAEFQLYEGNPQKALDAFIEVEAMLAADPSTIAPASPAATIAYQFRATFHASHGVEGNTLSSKLLQQTQEQLAARRSNVSESDVAALRAQLQTDASLSPDELFLVAVVLDSAEAGVHPGEFFPLREGYRAWTSTEATSIYHSLKTFVDGDSVALPTASVDAIRSTKPTASFFANEEELKKLLAAHKEGDLLDAIEKAFGRGPTSALGSHDDAFQAALASLDGASSGDQQKTKSATLQQQLIRQIGFRVAVNKAIALDRLNQPHEALNLLDKVISGNAYLYMWKAFLARGRVRQNLGLVDEADADFKALFALRVPYAKADIPLRDEYRTKSVF